MPQTQTTSGQTVTAQEFNRTSERFCHSYRLGDQVRDQAQLFEGQLTSGCLHSGIHFSTANLLATESSKHSVIFPKSVCIVFAIDGESSEIDPLQDGVRRLRRGETAIFRFSDFVRSESRYLKGQTSKSILVQLRENDLHDDRLREFAMRQTRGSDGCIMAANQRIAALGRALFEGRGCDTVRALMREARLLEMIAHVISDEAPNGATANKSQAVRLNRVRDMIESHPEQEHSLTSLAAVAGMSVSSLKEKFSSRFGTSVICYLRDVRLERARIGLQKDGWTVKEAAAHAGYRHPANFTTAFRKRFGTTPRAFLH